MDYYDLMQRSFPRLMLGIVAVTLLKLPAVFPVQLRWWDIPMAIVGGTIIGFLASSSVRQ
jgi:hypothetical protein